VVAVHESSEIKEKCAVVFGHWWAKWSPAYLLGEISVGGSGAPEGWCMPIISVSWVFNEDVVGTRDGQYMTLGGEYRLSLGLHSPL
jgi:hypothetical protein